MTVPPLSSSEDESARSQPGYDGERAASVGSEPSGLPTPSFGDLVENGWASKENPTRIGTFVREGRRTGRMNRGRYFELTDRKGKFWEVSPTGDHRLIVTPAATPSDPSTAWRGIESAPRDGTEIVFIGKYGHCSDVVHWRPPYTKLNYEFPGRFENWSGQATGMNDELAWLFWIPSPLPGAPS